MLQIRFAEGDQHAQATWLIGILRRMLSKKILRFGTIQVTRMPVDSDTKKLGL